jgi:two-component system sensor histidine kinase BaeS
LTVRCDGKRIEQVVSNLLSNAVKFTREGEIRIRLTDDGKNARVEITDSGAGIPADELPFVFDRLFRGASARSVKGTGIGLAIAKTWVEAHGGQIKAESAGPGRGSRFWFVIPKS